MKSFPLVHLTTRRLPFPTTPALSLPHGDLFSDAAKVLESPGMSAPSARISLGWRKSLSGDFGLGWPSNLPKPEPRAMRIRSSDVTKVPRSRICSGCSSSAVAVSRDKVSGIRRDQRRLRDSHRLLMQLLYKKKKKTSASIYFTIGCRTATQVCRKEKATD